MTIKVMSYEECREDFFVNLIKHAENKIKYWKRQKGFHCEIEENLSNAGAEISYCQDALKALEKQIPKKLIINEKDGMRHCPNCDTFFLSGGKRHCERCGHALDRSEEDG